MFLHVIHFLPRDATLQERSYATVCRPSVCPSVTFRYRDHIGWNSSKIISRPNSLRLLHGLTPIWMIWCTGTPQN